MIEERKLTFAPFVAAACVLGIVAAATGSQGFTIVIGLLGISALFFARPGLRMPAYGYVLLAALIWISVTAIWSPASGSFLSGTISGGNFAIDVASIRIFGVAIFSAAAISASLKIPAGKAEKSINFSLMTIAVTFVLLCLLYIYRDATLAAAYPGDASKAQHEGVQNIQRAANAVAIFLPIGLAIGWSKFQSWIIRAILASTAIAAMILFQLFNSQSAVVSFFLMLVCFSIIRMQPAGGITTIFRLIAVYILMSPVVMYAGVRIMELMDLRLPVSFQVRLYAWDETISRILDRPIIGHGLEATGTWKEAVGAHPEKVEKLMTLVPDDRIDAFRELWRQFPVVPGHPHNMPLEVWVETGAIGAILIAAAVWLAGDRIGRADRLSGGTNYATAGFIGAVLPFVIFAYSAWNEAFWGMLALFVCVIILFAKRAQA